MIVAHEQNAAIAKALNFLHYATPIILLVFFLIAFAARSILYSNTAAVRPSTPSQLGPGGKPLPVKKPISETAKLKAALDFSRPRKLLFNSLSAFAAITYLANSAIVILHALVERKNGWWCGEAVVVSPLEA